MKTKVIEVLNQCVFNKPINQFDSITKFIHTLQRDNTCVNSMEHDTKDLDLGYESISITLWTEYNNKRKLICIVFNNSEYISIHNECGCTNAFVNCGYNTQYDEIRALLLSE